MALTEAQRSFVEAYILSRKPAAQAAGAKADPVAAQPAAADPVPESFDREDAPRLRALADELRAAILATLGSAHAALGTELDRIGGEIAVAEAQADAAAFEAAIAAPARALDAIHDRLERLGAARQGYLAALSQAEALKTALEGHAQYATLDAARKDPVEAALTQARTAAAGHDYDAARAALTEFEARRREALAEADAAARFAVVLPAREAESAALETAYNGLDWAGAPVPPALAAQLVAVRKLVTDAKAEGAATGLAKLDGFAPAAAAFRTEFHKAHKYLTNCDWTEQLLSGLEAAKPPFVTGAEVAEQRTAFDRAQAEAGAGKLSAASDILDGLWSSLTLLDARQTQWQSCSDGIREAADRRKTWAGLAGKDPAKVPLQTYDQLLTQCQAKLATCEFGAVVARLKELTKLADELDVLDSALDKIQTDLTAAAAAPENAHLGGTLERAQAALTEAEQRKLAGKFTEAQELGKRAQALIDSLAADNVWVTQAETDEQALTALTADMAANGAAALAELDRQLNTWNGYTPAGFTAAFGAGAASYSPDHMQEARDKYAEADDALNTAQPPEPDTAKARIGEAVALFLTGVKNALAAGQYVAHDTEVEGKKAKTSSTFYNQVIYDAAVAAQAEAKLLAEAHDYRGAATKLLQAEAGFEEAKLCEDRAEDYNAVVVNGPYASLSTTDCDQAAISAEYVALQAKQAQIDAAWNQGDHAVAAALQQELQKESEAAYVKGCAVRVENDIAAVRGLDAHGVATAALDAIQARVDEARAKAARGITDTAGWDVYALIAETAEQKRRAEAKNEYEATRAAAEAKVDALTAPRDALLPNAAATARAAAVRAAYDRAVALDAGGTWVAARDALASAAADADAALLALQTLKTSLDGLTAAAGRRRKAGPERPVELQLEQADERLAEARARLDAGDAAAADAATAAAAALLDAADRILADAAALGKDRDDAGQLAEGAAPVTAELLAPLIAKAETGLAAVQGRIAELPQQQSWATSIEAALTTAGGAPGKAAAEALTRCLDMIANAAADAGQARAFAALKKTAADELAAIAAIAKGGDFVAPERTAIGKYLALAEADAGTALFSSAFRQLRSAEVDLAAARRLAEDYRIYSERLEGPVAAAVKAVRESPHRFAVADEIDEIDRLLERAATAVGARDAATARAQLDGVEGMCALCEVKLKVSKGEAPDEQTLNDLVALNGGPAYLDDYVAGLDPRINREAMINVTKARFGLDVVAFHSSYDEKTLLPTGPSADGTTVPAINLRAMYALMKEVPDAFTRDNPSLKELRKYDEADYSFYDPQGKGLAMRCGRATDDTRFAIGSPWEIDRSPLAGEVRDAALVLDHVDHAAPEPDYFSWQVWHELAHSIDDKTGFMNANQSAPKYGGWQVHGNNVKPIADAAARHFRCDNEPSRRYIEHLLLGRSPAAPADTDMDEATRLDIAAWHEAIKTGNNIWDNGSATRKHALGDRMYHEAYANSWVSYELKQRALGVTGYQFRAPGEWFSELYAALKTGKLKNSHPAYAELSQY